MNLIKTLREHISEILGLLVLLIVHLKFTFNLSAVSDIVLADESGVIARSIDFSVKNLRGDGWLYILWYKLLDVFSGNLLELYFINNIVLIGLNSYFIYLILLKSKVHRLISLISAVVFMISTINADIWPFVTRLALASILLTYYISMFFQKREEVLLVWNIGAFFTMYIRPEFTITFYAITLVNLWFLIVAHIKTWRNNKKILFYKKHVMMFCLIAGIVVFGSPMKGSRSILAFGQHFSINYTAWTGQNINPWTNWEAIMNKTFKTTSSISEAFRNNSVAFLRHLNMNRKNLFSNLLLHLRPTGVSTEYSKKMYKAFARLFVVLALIVLVLHFGRMVKSKRFDFSDTINRFILLIIFFMPPVFFSAILIYPRLHYVIMLIGLLFILTILLINPLLPSIRFRQKKYHIIAEIIIIILIVYSVPFKVSGEPGFKLKHAKYIQEKEPTNVQIINTLSKIKWNENTVLLSMRPGLPVFLNPEVKHIFGGEKTLAFDEYMHKNKITAILVTEDLLTNVRFKDDDAFLKFIANPRGFKKTKINDDVYLLSR